MIRCVFVFSLAPVACSNNYYSLARATACSPCPTGYQCPTTSTIQACASGFYSDGLQTACSECAAGFYCPNTHSGADVFACDQGRLTDSSGSCSYDPVFAISRKIIFLRRLHKFIYQLNRTLMGVLYVFIHTLSHSHLINNHAPSLFLTPSPLNRKLKGVLYVFLKYLNLYFWS